MKPFLLAAKIILFTSLSTGLQAASFAASDDDTLQARSQPDETASEHDAAGSNTATSNHQSQDKSLKVGSLPSYELFLEQVRATSKQQAAEAAYNLSVLAVSRKDIAKARTHIEESVQLDQSNPIHLAFAADIAFMTQQYDKAASYQMTLLEMARAEPGVDDLQLADILDQLGAIYFAQEDYGKTHSSLTESLQLREKVLGDTHLLVALSLNKLASLAIRQHQPYIAESRLKRALDIARDVSGSRHANTATLIASLADLYHGVARLEEAEGLYEEAISIWRDSSAEPLALAVCRTALGRLLLKQQRYEGAHLQFEQALHLLEQNYTEDHPYVQQAIQNLTKLDAERTRSERGDAMYDELVRELSVRSPTHM